MRHISAFDTVSLLIKIKLCVEEINASSCIEKTGGSAHVCIINGITEEELARRSGTFWNVQRTHHRWKLFVVAWR